MAELDLAQGPRDAELARLKGQLQARAHTSTAAVRLLRAGTYMHACMPGCSALSCLQAGTRMHACMHAYPAALLLLWLRIEWP